ncbi:NAD-dependent epimerase/dehydratase family protein [Sphaerisporangium rubeum]|uniref:Nucleoside-diphosphate-sugar epimerase n=1 Tax=Sphaerisporangium rubeum TaxID=321317 RepID=A0A7X0M8I3_9ACTN|nr:nucleoside-diphosphate-sugar epimerase [Sphaerisporangium rubeum]
MARRPAGWTAAKTEWHTADIAADDLTEVFRGADAVVHLAWLFQPTRTPSVTWRANVLGASRVFRAVAEAKVPALVYASSVGAYSPGPKDHPVDESWPTHGWPGAAYGREKAYVERLLDIFERDHPGLRVVRMRPGFIFKRESATGQRRLFAGPFLPRRLVRPGALPVVPDIPGLRLQALHTEDVAEAYRLAVTGDIAGPVNLAADPVITPAVLADLWKARLVPVPRWAAREAAALAWHLHLVPASPGLVEMALMIPVMDTTRARTELGWTPRHTSLDALSELVTGLREGTGLDSPPLQPDTGLRSRLHELTTGIGRRP